jgi:hypothetical protein
VAPDRSLTVGISLVGLLVLILVICLVVYLIRRR